MEMRPHLSFLPPAISKRDGLPGGGDSLATPSASAQYRRFEKSFNQLKKQFAEHVSLSETIDGLSPEKILVIEVAGCVKDFIGALKRIPEFTHVEHFLTDEEVEQDLIRTEKGKSVRREIYLTMSNQDGLHRLLAHWNKFSKGQDQHGFTPLKHALQQLHCVRFWDTQDRIKNTGLLEDWDDRVSYCNEYGGLDEFVPFEIELWFHSSDAKRAEVESVVGKLVKACGGSITAPFNHVSIAYHALRGQLPIGTISEVLNKGADYLQFIRCDHIMYLRPLGQCGFGIPDVEQEVLNEELPKPNPDMPDGPPVAALFDGLPLENHTALVDRMIVHDPDDFSSRYQRARDQLHGTAMASLIIHGDKEGNESPLPSPLYVRPILVPGRENLNGKRLEGVPEDILPLDLIHRAVRQLFEGDGGEDPAAPTIKVINLSVCDPSRLFDRSMSPWARMLDWLAHRYGVLFIVSAGNHLEDLHLDVSNEEFSSLTSKEIEQKVVEAIYRDRWKRRLMSPAESVNALTVKASHHDHSNAMANLAVIDPFETSYLFSPINPVCLGKSKSVKPELIVPGGRATYRNTTYTRQGNVVLSVIDTPKAFAPGQKVATPSHTAGSVSAFGYSYGTSNAAALATRRAVLLNETIQSMQEFQENGVLDHAPRALILKALLVHGAEFPAGAVEALSSAVVTKDNDKAIRNEFFGYGNLQEQRIHGCSPNQATLIRTGELELEHSHIYDFPLPPCLAGSSEARTMIATVAWFSPINPLHQDYSQAQLWISNIKKASPIRLKDGDYYHHYLKNGSVYHEVVKGKQVSDYMGAKEMHLRVNGRARGGALGGKIPYALVVTLIADNEKLPIYEQVKAILVQTLEERIRAKADVVL